MIGNMNGTVSVQVRMVSHIWKDKIGLWNMYEGWNRVGLYIMTCTMLIKESNIIFTCPDFGNG